MKYRRIFALLFVLILSLTACGREQVPPGNGPLDQDKKIPGKGAINTPTEDGGASGSAASEGAAAWLSVEGGKVLDDLREGAQADGCICSVAFLGAALEPGEDIAAFLASEEAEQYLDAYPFIKEIPPERWIAHPEGGYEVYCIVPTDPKASTAVNTWDINEDNDFLGESDQVLYRSDCGDPILLLGNLSDIMPSLDVEIVDSTGRSLSYQPSLWLYDGSLSGPSEIFDFTMYHNPDLIGIWSAVIPAELGGGISLNLNIGRGGNLTYSYGRGNSEPIALYEGTWSRPDEAMVQFGPECVVFELRLVEGIEDNDLWGQYGPGELHDEICGVWICERGDGPGTSSLRLTHVQGDPFIDGCGGWAIVFEGEDQGGDNGGMEQGANVNPHVLTTGGPAFTHMTVLQTENYPDGGYYYEDMTQDGSILIINCAYPGGRRNGVSMEEYAVKSIEHLTMYEAEDLSVEKNSGYSEALGHPVYILTYTTSENDHTFHWKIFMTEADGYTYLYAFDVWHEVYADMEDVIDDVFGRLFFLEM